MRRRNRGPLATFMLASFVIGAALMILFEETLTRVFGMAALIAFMVSGVFLVADPSMLDPEADEYRRSDETADPAGPLPQGRDVAPG